VHGVLSGMQANHPNLRSLLNSPYPQNQQKQRVARSLRNYVPEKKNFLNR
jgi:hypothetical protein